jgi:NADPH-dependent 2,4-dienoyl-CoA reductase/sulfur reductase-like enzyme/rhodanese-related sulfurtransferase
MERILIIGGVAAGATAAAKARRLSPTARITVLEAGPDISFANCGLPYYIGGDIERRSALILASPESFKQQYDVAVHTETAAESIDLGARKVHARSSRTGELRDFEYDKLILAQGGRPIAPDLPGAKSDHVFTLWTLQDMDRIDAFLKSRKPAKATIAGGGFIGLEMAEALAKRGIEVHVVEKMPHVLSVLDPEIAGFVETEMLERGVKLHKGVGVTEIGGDHVVLEDGSRVESGMVLLSIGVRPTLQLAKDAGLELGPAGGLLVDRFLRTSDPHVWAAGDMVEIEHRVHGAKVRIPLAGPANRQGRIAAENALGGSHPYNGALGTSIVRVFDAVAGTTGLSLRGAKAAGIDAVSVTVHKEHHTAYYPGSKPVTVKLVVERATGRILGGQTAGFAGADRRLDVVAMAAASKMTVHDLADVDFAYSPPLGTANDAVNMAAYVAQNRLSGYGPSLSVEELDALVSGKVPAVVDVRDEFAHRKARIEGSINLPLDILSEQISRVPKDRSILVYDETGKKGHQAVRQFLGAGIDAINVSGGFQSVLRHARAMGYKNLPLLLPTLEDRPWEKETPSGSVGPTQTSPSGPSTGKLVVDVRTPGEFATGAFPGAVNIPVDELPSRIAELGAKDREIVLYCASGARSGYASKILAQVGFSNLENGGGIAQMMARPRAESGAAKPAGRMVVDVRTPGEFAGGAIPGAVNIPVDELPSRIGELGAKDREIILYCASGARSGYAQRILAQAGFSNLVNGGGIAQMMRGVR